MNITLHIEAANPAELQEAIAGLAGITGGASAPQPEPEKLKKKKQEKAAETKPAPEPEAEPVEEPGTEETEETTDTPKITLEQVRAKLAALSQAGKQVQVKKLITDFGAAKLTEIPEEKYPKLLAAAEKLA